MPIPYSLVPNRLTEAASDYAARARPYRSIGYDEIAGRIVEQGSTVNKADVLAVLHDAETACEHYLLEGHRVVLGGLVNLFPRVRGVFDDISDAFDVSRHSVDVGANAGRRIRETVQTRATVEKIEATKPVPKPERYSDVGSGAADSTVTVGNIGKLDGRRLKFDPTIADEGVYFLADEGAETKVAFVSDITPSRLRFLVPPLTPGTYYLEVRARMNDTADLRSGRHLERLVVP